MTSINPMDGWQPYSEKSGLENLYLEDSFVLSVDGSEKEVCFRVEFVLTENHPKYSPPNPGEQYCYRLGEICFSGIRKVKKCNVKKILDKGAGQIHDLGNIDVFLWRGDRYFLSGDWGELDIEAEIVKASFYEH